MEFGWDSSTRGCLYRCLNVTIEFVRLLVTYSQVLSDIEAEMCTAVELARIMVSVE